MADEPILTGKGLKDMAYVPDPVGAEGYAEKGSKPYRVRYGEPGGLATLDGAGKVPEDQLDPNIGASPARLDEAEARLDVLEVSQGDGVPGVANYADIATLFPTPTEGQQVDVLTDADPAKVGRWGYLAGAWVKSTDRVTAIEEDVTALEGDIADLESRGLATGKINGWPDPFFRTFDLASQNLFGRDRWYGGLTGFTLAANTAFDGNALRRTADLGPTALGGPAIWLDEIGAVAGDVITVYLLVVGSGAVVTAPGRFFTDSDAVSVGVQMNATSAAAGSTVTSSATPQWLRHTIPVPATATRFAVYPYTATAGQTFDIVAVWAFKGAAATGPAWPTLSDPDGNAFALAAMAGAVVPNAANEIRNAFQPYAVLESSLGDAENAGDADYANVASTMGFYEQASEATLFNTIIARVWQQSSTDDVEWRVWIRDAVTAFNMDTTTPDASGIVAAANFPDSDSLFTLQLDDPLLVEAGQFVFVMFRGATGTRINVRRWLYNAAITPARHGFPFSTTSGWNNTFSYSNPAAGYGQTAIKLLLESAELRAKGVLTQADVDVSVDAAINVAPEMIVPPYLFGVQGREANCYFDNLFLCDADEYLISASSAYGKHQAERWTWTPAGAVSSTVTITAANKRTGEVLATEAVPIRSAASSAGSGLTKKVLIIGDSLIDAGVVTQTLLDIAATDVMAVTLLGTRGATPNFHEGRGGWTVARYTSDYGPGQNPFWISGTVNFPQYLINNALATPDWVFINLGTNDVFNSTSDSGAASAAATAFTSLDTLITSIKAAGAGVKVGLMISPPPSASQDAFGANYGAAYSRWRFKRNILVWARELISKYEGQEASRIYIVPSNTALDTLNNMQVGASAPVNSRSLVSVTRQNNGVHPADEGYDQMADALWAFLKFYAAA